MKRISVDDLELCADSYHDSISHVPGLDAFCCRLDWILPFHEAFQPERSLAVWKKDDSFLVLAESRTDSGRRILCSAESLWGFASALIGRDAPRMLAELFSGTTKEIYIDSLLALSGLPGDAGFLRQVAESVKGTHRVLSAVPTIRRTVSCRDGLDGYLGRRSARFRRSLKQAVRRAERHGIVLRCDDILRGAALDDAYRRILAVEARSWKGRAGEGADQPPMREFYRCILDRIAPAGYLRLLTAEHGGDAVGYIYGARIGDHFRGLQFSFDERFRDFSLGNVLQYHMLDWMTENGCRRYDLGMDVDYKRRWSDATHVTYTLYLAARNRPDAHGTG